MHYQEYRLRTKIRELWSDTACSIHLLIISKTNKTDDDADILERLMIDQEEISAVLKPYYDKEVVTELAELLKENIYKTRDVIINTIDENTELLTESKIDWYKNVNDISSFLFEVNAHIYNKNMKNMLLDYLDSIENILTSRMREDFNYEFIALNDTIQYTMMIADAISEAIIDEFQDKFRNNKLDVLM